MTLSWIKCTGNKWCPLDTVDLDHPHFEGLEGVYIIWHGGPKAATVRVGQGVIRDRLRAHRSDTAIQAFSEQGLYVTWAAVGAGDRDGVETYLASRLNPLVGDRFPLRIPIEVNLPW